MGTIVKLNTVQEYNMAMGVRHCIRLLVWSTSQH